MVPSETVLIGGIIACLVIAIVFILIVQIRNSYRLDRLTTPIYEYIEQKAKQRAEAIIAEADKKAEAVLDSAEQSRQEMLKQHEHDVAEYVAQVKEEIKQHSQRISQQLESVVNAQVAAVEHVGKDSLPKLETAHDALTNRVQEVETSFATLEETVSATASKVTQSLEESAQSAVAAFEKKLASYDSSVAEAFEKETNRLLEEVEKSVATYGETQKTIIDRHIAEIVEDVAKQVLHRQLTLTEHALVATEALEEAKQKGLL